MTAMRKDTPHIVPSLFEFPDQLLLGRVLEHDGWCVEVLGDVFQGKMGMQGSGAEKALRARYLAMEQFVPDGWSIAMVRTDRSADAA